MKPIVRGKSVYFREASRADAVFIHKLRSDSRRSKFLSPTPQDLASQERYMEKYEASTSEYYFVICDWNNSRLGTVRIYNLSRSRFTWGSWLLAPGTPNHVALESAILLYDFGFFALHCETAFFDARKENRSVVLFHSLFGARVLEQDDANIYFDLSKQRYEAERARLLRFLSH